mgnify:CR=1 FL=1
MNWKKITIDETESTNTYISKVEGTNVVVSTDYQTAGRGQGDNHWDSERGKNLLFSLKISPTTIPVKRQFLLSMVGALAVKGALDKYTDGITLKWPNDIYWNDKKISGTLIQTTISGKNLQDCIFGVGLNLNQKEFADGGPNPVSLYQIIGREIPRHTMLDEILLQFESYYNELINDGETGIIKSYHDALYRKEGFYDYQDAKGTFKAEIVQVKRNGHIVLRDTEGILRQYELKDIKFVI